MATEITRKAVMRLRQCRLCGTEYESRHTLKIFCDDCRRQREREADKLRAQRKARANGRREIGQTYQCKVCGQDYILDWAPRKQCDPCSASRVARWQSEKRSSDPAFSIATRMQRRMNECLGRGGKGGRNWENLVGYTVDQLVAHIERQFQRGMTWENRGRGISTTSFRSLSSRSPTPGALNSKPLGRSQIFALFGLRKTNARRQSAFT